MRRPHRIGRVVGRRRAGVRTLSLCGEHAHRFAPLRAPLPTGAVRMKTQMSRFHIHDELTAPEGVGARPQGRPGRRRPAPQLPRRARRLAGGAARLRAVPLRAAPRLADAGHARAHRARRRRALRAPSPGSPCTARTARARPAWASTRSRWPASSTPRRARGGAAALPQGRSSSSGARRRCTSTRRRARPAGTTSSCSRRSPYVALESFTAMVNVAGDVPVDGSVEEARAAARRLPEPASRAHEVAGATLSHAGERAARYYHEAIELIGKRWTGAIVVVLLDGRGRCASPRSARPCPSCPTGCCPSG